MSASTLPTTRPSTLPATIGTPTLVVDGNRGRPAVGLVYILYLIAFAILPTMLIGVGLAYAARPGASPSVRPFFDHQIRIFWHGLHISLVNILVILLTAAVGAASGGVGFILEIIPIIIGLYTAVWFFNEIRKGMQALNRGSPNVP